MEVQPSMSHLAKNGSQNNSLYGASQNKCWYALPAKTATADNWRKRNMMAELDCIFCENTLLNYLLEMKVINKFVRKNVNTQCAAELQFGGVGG